MRDLAAPSRYGRAMPFEVATEVFQGPITLLARLVAEHEVDIYDVPLAEVVDGFLAALSSVTMDKLPVDEVSEFLLVAAVLVELKSRKLLPSRKKVVIDDELASIEERDRLLGRLVELQAFSAAAREMALMLERAALSVPRTAGLDEAYVGLEPDLLHAVSPRDLADAYARAAVRAAESRPEPTVALDHVTVEAVTVFEAVEEIASVLPAKKNATFRELTSSCRTRMEVIVRFLAVLELCKRGMLEVDQAGTFGELHLSWTGAHVSPVYEEPDRAAKDARGDGRESALSLAVASMDEYEG